MKEPNRPKYEATEEEICDMENAKRTLFSMGFQLSDLYDTEQETSHTLESRTKHILKSAQARKFFDGIRYKSEKTGKFVGNLGKRGGWVGDNPQAKGLYLSRLLPLMVLCILCKKFTDMVPSRKTSDVSAT